MQKLQLTGLTPAALSVASMTAAAMGRVGGERGYCAPRAPGLAAERQTPDEDMVARSVVNMTQTKKNCKIQRFCALACRMIRTRPAPLPTSSTIPTPSNSIEHMSPPLQVGGGRTSWGFPPERHGPGPRHWPEWTEAPQRGLLNRLSHHTPAITDRVQP